MNRVCGCRGLTHCFRAMAIAFYFQIHPTLGRIRKKLSSSVSVASTEHHIYTAHTHTHTTCVHERSEFVKLACELSGVRLYERTHSRFVGIFVFFLVEWKLNWKQKPNLMNINVICVCVCAGTGLDCNLPNDNDTSTWYIGIMHLLI